LLAVGTQATQPTTTPLQAKLRKPSGHGNEDEIAFVDIDGKTKTLSTEVIAELMRVMSDNIRVVLFNTCRSGQQAKAVVAHVDVAIGMNGNIKDDAARIFVASFYRAIGFGRSVLQAYEQGKLALQLEGIPQEHVPEMHTRDGIDANDIVLVRL